MTHQYNQKWFERICPKEKDVLEYRINPGIHPGPLQEYYQNFPVDPSMTAVKGFIIDRERGIVTGSVPKIGTLTTYLESKDLPLEGRTEVVFKRSMVMSYDHRMRNQHRSQLPHEFGLSLTNPTRGGSRHSHGSTFDNHHRRRGNDFVSLDVTLTGGEHEEHTLVRTTNYMEAYMAAKDVSRFLGLRLVDETIDSRPVYEPEYLDETYRERLIREGKTSTGDVKAPASTSIVYSRTPQEQRFVFPRRSVGFADVFLGGVGVGFILIGAVGVGPELIIKIPPICFGVFLLGAIIIGLLMHEELVIDSSQIAVCAVSPIKSDHQSMQLASLRDIHVTRGGPIGFSATAGIQLRSDEDVVFFGYSASQEELLWIKSVIDHAMLSS